MAVVAASSKVKSSRFVSSRVATKSQLPFVCGKLLASKSVAALNQKVVIQQFRFCRVVNKGNVTQLTRRIRSGVIPRQGFTVGKISQFKQSYPLVKTSTVIQGGGQGSKRPSVGQIFPRGYR